MRAGASVWVNDIFEDRARAVAESVQRARRRAAGEGRRHQPD